MKKIIALLLFFILKNSSFAQENVQQEKENIQLNPTASELYTLPKEKVVDPEKIKFHESILAKELSESWKIILMSTIAAVSYGIVHDLITTQICIEYFSSDRTHHGPFTKKYMPWVYKANNKILYALAWAPLATIPHGLVAGILWAIAARSNSDNLSWRNMVLPTSVFMSTLLFSTIIVGIIEYNKEKDNFNTVAEMHNWSYGAGTVGAIGMIFYFYLIDKSGKNIVTPIPNGISINFASMLIKDY